MKVSVTWHAYPAQANHAEPRINPVGIQYLPWNLQDKIFTSNTSKSRRQLSAKERGLIDISKRHLDDNGLLGKKTSIVEPITMDLPKLEGRSLDEHFYKLGMYSSEPYLGKSKQFAASSVPPRPQQAEWLLQSGWTKYEAGKAPVRVAYPDENDALVFDTEVLYKISDFPVLATACSATAWYGWVSPWLLGETENLRNLIPLGSKEEKIVIGHNIAYDRKRISEEYNIKPTKSMFIDTMSLHISVSGMCSRQRPDYQRIKKTKRELNKIDIEQIDEDIIQEVQMLETAESENPWIRFSSLNNLADVGLLHCGISHNKEVRDDFGTMTREEAHEDFSRLMDYCARDVDTTFQVYKALLPQFLKVSPHPVTFAGLRHMSSMFLPINKSWENYIESSDRCYYSSLEEVYNSLVKLAETAVSLKDKPEEWQKDPWLKQLDWTIKPFKMIKGKKGEPPRLPKNLKLPGYPEWYKKLFPKAGAPMNLTVRSRVSSLLLRLQWEGHPLIWSDVHGFVFKVQPDEERAYLKKNFTKADMNTETNMALKDDTSGVYIKVPHKDGPAARCTNPMSKSYLSYFEKGLLTSEYEIAAKALQLNAQCSYWISNRERIHSQMPIWSDDADMGVPTNSPKDFGIILPSLIPMGTVTRRAVENTWLTASNAKKNRIGSELKAMIQAPPGYKFVGADVDSEELWIASVVGDSLFKMHGGTPLGWMTLEGTKSEGTDLHSKTAKILNISRNEAKIFNYGRIYGAGIKFATQLLKQFRPELSMDEATATANELYTATKGIKSKSVIFGDNKFWRAGTESIIFNRLEEMANQDLPRTPVLGVAITQALMAKNLGKSGFLTSRINWTIQSSGVDYLHLLVTSMQYLIDRYGIDARLMITVHDELRYMSSDADTYRTALALQISNIWTRAMFCEQLGISDLPYSCAFFSAVDIDHVLRKETDMDCVTPSNPTPIEFGESLDMKGLLNKCDTLTSKSSKQKRLTLSKIDYQARVPVLEDLDRIKQSQVLKYMEVQVCKSVKELKAIEWDIDWGVRSRGTQVLDHVEETTKKTTKKTTKPKEKMTAPKSTEVKMVRKMKPAVTDARAKPRTPRVIPDRTHTDPVIRVVEPLPSQDQPAPPGSKNTLAALMAPSTPPPSPRVAAEEVFTAQELQEIFMSTGA